MPDSPLATSVKLVSGHPDDQRAESAALEAFRTSNPVYSAEWPRATAYRFLHAMSGRDDAEARAREAGPPSEKDLATFIRVHAPSRERERFKVHDALLLYEVVHGSERVASEIVAHLERRANDVWTLTDEHDHLFTLLGALALVRDRMTFSDRSRLDARIRLLLAFHRKGTPVAEELEGLLRRPESLVPPPPIEAAVERAKIEPAPIEAAAEVAVPAPAKKAAKKKKKAK